MIIIIGIIVPMVFFLVALPLQMTIKVVKVRLHKEIQEERKGEKKSIDDFVRGRGIKESKGELYSLRKLHLQAMIQLVRAMEITIKVLKGVAKTLISLVVTGLVIVIPTVPLIISSLVVVVTLYNNGVLNVGNGGSVIIGGVTAGDNNSGNGGSGGSSGSTNVVDRVNVSENVKAWLDACEEMARWYMANVKVYNQGGFFSCELVGGDVRADCTGFMYACLINAGLIKDNPRNANSSGNWLQGGSVGLKLEQAGFECIPAGVGFKWQTGDIAVVKGHVELVEYVEGDLLRQWGWGIAQTRFPLDFQPMENFKSSKFGYYPVCYRLRAK